MEVFIFIYTSRNNDKSNKKDKGSLYLMILGICLSIWASIDLNPTFLKLPNIFFYIGILFMTIGILLRCISLFILRKFFTVSVQTNSKQQLVTKGPYHILRHPAYSSTILCIISISFCMKNLIGFIISMIILVAVYSYRINIEEKALIERFGNEYLSYKIKTYKLIPFIYEKFRFYFSYLQQNPFNFLISYKIYLTCWKQRVKLF